MDSKNSMLLIGGHGSEIEALLRRQQELVTGLRALILPPLHGVDGRLAELAVQLFDDVLGCNTTAVSRLQGCFSIGGAAIELVDDKSLVRRNSTGTAERFDEQARRRGSVSQNKRRNNGKRSRSLVTNVPHYDGHQWRKYGQKNINGRQHARSYYRCTYRERDCSATKTIQQEDQNGVFNYDQEAANYTVVYYGHHTCQEGKNSNGGNNNMDLPQLVNMDLQSSEMAPVATENNQEFEGDLDMPALLEVLDNSKLNWEIMF